MPNPSCSVPDPLGDGLILQAFRPRRLPVISRVEASGFGHGNEKNTGKVAEREGFEPSVPLVAVHAISSRAPSANSDISPKSQPIPGKSILIAITSLEVTFF